MRVYAITARRWIETTIDVVSPFTSVVVSVPSDMVDLEKATAADVLYLNLHGYVNKAMFRGQGLRRYSMRPVALDPQEVAGFDWSGTTVFAEVCHSALNKEMVRAFMDSGAKAFIGSTSEAYGRVRPAPGQDAWGDRLASIFLRFFCVVNSPRAALTMAKMAYFVDSAPISMKDRATLDSFIIVEDKDE